MSFVEPWHAAIIVKGLWLIVMFGIAKAGMLLLKEYLPEGRIKRFLFISWDI